MIGHLMEHEETQEDAPRRASPEGKPTVKAGGIAADQLRSIVQRIENLEESKADIASDIRDIYAEAHGNGFCRKTLRKIIKLRAMDAAERDEAEHLLDTYARAVGLRPQLELFNSED